MGELWTVGLTGAAVGGAIGLPLLRAAAGSLRTLGWLLLFGGLSGAVIAARHGGLLGAAMHDVSEHVTHAGNLVFWAALVAWVRAAMNLTTPRYVTVWAFAAPLGAYVAYALLAGDVPRFMWLLPAGWIASIHMALLWARRAEHAAKDVGTTLAARMIAFGVALNVAQTLRTVFPQHDLLREVVPITMTAGFLSLASLAVQEMLARERPDRATGSLRYAKSALDKHAAARLLALLEERMGAEHWYRDRSLSLAELARRLETRPHVVSQAVNQVRGVSLNDYLTAWRLADAKRLLADPGSDRFTVDGLAESAGFASRSAFYRAFKASEGVTPTEFRARSRQPLGQSPVGM
jgi:AraC-like DNA-binding protein